MAQSTHQMETITGRTGGYMARKITRKGLIKKIDTLHREVMEKLYPKKCVQCGSTNAIGVGHVFSRRTYNTRWDFKPAGNCYWQCWPCNYRHVRDQYPYFTWFKNTYGDKALEELRARFSVTRRWTTQDLLVAMEYLKDQL